MINHSRLFVVPSMEQNHSVRICTYFSSIQKEILKSCEAPLLRVGRFLIYRTSLEPLKNATEVQAMLRHTLITVLAFPTFLKAISNLNIHIARVLALVIVTFLSVRYCRRSIEDLSYGVAKINGGSLSFSRLPFPAYVIHRYFPKFKGYSRIDPVTLFDNMRRLGNGEIEQLNESVAPLYYSDEEYHKINTRLHNAMSRCWLECPDLMPSTFDEYYRMHINIWNMYKSNLLRFQMENDSLFLLRSMIILKRFCRW